MKISIVTTLYNSSPYLEEFVRRVHAAVQQISTSYELILVNDGSPDDSLEVALRLRDQNPVIKIVDLSRNFGHHKAMMRGLQHASGERVFIVDSDLEEAPELMIGFAEQMDRDRCDVVYGVQKKRKGRFFERWSGAIAYAIFNATSYVRTEPNIIMARLMTRRYVEALMQFNERESVFFGLCILAGFEQRPQTVVKAAKATSTYTFQKKLALMIDMITSFSSRPLVWIFYTGLFIFLSSFGYTVGLVINKIFFKKPLAGWTSIMASVWLLGGLIILFIGMVGIYVSKIFTEAKQRPSTIIKKIYE